MKYYLAIDKGIYVKSENRYIFFDLSNIHDKLSENNNLKALCTFTMAFEDSGKLKEFLITKGLLLEKYYYYDLVIAYRMKGMRTLLVPYKGEEQFFDKNYLFNVVGKAAANDNFLMAFLDYFGAREYQPDELLQLREIQTNPYSLGILDSRMRTFLDSYIYYNGKINYKRLHEVAMFAARYLKKEKERKQSETFSSRSQWVLTEAEWFKLEEWQDKKELDGQMKLF